MTGRRSSRSARIAFWVVGVLIAAGCGGGGDDGANQGDNGSDSAEQGQGGGGGDNIRRVNFVPPGPTDDDTPRGNQWYEFLSEGKCQALRDDVEDEPRNDPPVILYRAAAEACTGKRAEAAQDLNTYLSKGIPIDAEDCGRAFVIEFVQEVLRAAQADPNVDITFEKSGRRPPCEKNDDDGGDETPTTIRRSTTTSRSATTTR